MRYEYPLADGTRADYVLCDRSGKALAVLEAKWSSRALGEGEALAHAAALGVWLAFLANGEEVCFRDLDRVRASGRSPRCTGGTSWSGASRRAYSASRRAAW